MKEGREGLDFRDVTDAVNTKVFEVDDEADGIRLDHFLDRQFPQVSRVWLRRIAANGKVHVNRRAARGGRKLRAGDIVEIEIPDTLTPALIPEPIPITVVLEDDHLLVVDKPAGMLVYPSPAVTSGTLMNALCFHLQPTSPGARPGLVHRLDRQTSGLIIVAKTQPAHRVLAKHFRQRRVVKKYLALVHGHVARDSFEIGLSIGWVENDYPHWQVTLDGREAVTSARVLQRIGQYTLIEAEPKTGRTHQIRVHLAATGHPIVGDAVYGKQHHEGFRKPVESIDIGFDRHFLHASCLQFNHPTSGERLELSSPLPEDLAMLVERIKSQTDIR
jgi:23S rRNA pseudouridine1911/1915/1917 synthase